MRGTAPAVPWKSMPREDVWTGRSAYTDSGDDAYLLRLRALLALRDFELDALPVLERLVAVHLDRREVDEHVLPPVDRDESVALLAVEPLHGALCHGALPSLRWCWVCRPPTPPRGRCRRAFPLPARTPGVQRPNTHATRGARAPHPRNSDRYLTCALSRPSGPAYTCRRDWITRKRLATYAPSVSEAFAAGFAPLAWKSENAADWLTNTPPVRFADRCTPTSSAAFSTSSSTSGEVEYTLAVRPPFTPTIRRNS